MGLGQTNVTDNGVLYRSGWTLVLQRHGAVVERAPQRLVAGRRRFLRTPAVQRVFRAASQSLLPTTVLARRRVPPQGATRLGRRVFATFRIRVRPLAPVQRELGPRGTGCVGEIRGLAVRSADGIEIYLGLRFVRIRGLRIEEHLRGVAVGWRAGYRRCKHAGLVILMDTRDTRRHLGSAGRAMASIVMTRLQNLRVHQQVRQFGGGRLLGG